MQIELLEVVEKGGRVFTVGQKTRCGLLVDSILRIGNYVRVSMGAETGLVRCILLHIDDLKVERAASDPMNLKN